MVDKSRQDITRRVVVMRMVRPTVRHANIVASDYWQLRQSVVSGSSPVIVCDKDAINGRPPELGVLGGIRRPAGTLIRPEFPVLVLEIMKL